MEVEWYILSPKLLEGVALCNTIPKSKFTSLIARLFKATREKQNPFTDDEIKNMQNVFKLSENELKLMLTSLAYVVKRSMLFIIKPTTLEEDLTNKFKFEQDKSEEIVKIWTEYTKNDIGDLEKRQILEKFTWELNLEIASDSNSKKAVPCSVLQFKIKNTDEQNENITIATNEEQLVEIYNQIEQMQSVIDSIK